MSQESPGLRTQNHDGAVGHHGNVAPLPRPDNLQRTAGQSGVGASATPGDDGAVGLHGSKGHRRPRDLLYIAGERFTYRVAVASVFSAALGNDGAVGFHGSKGSLRPRDLLYVAGERFTNCGAISPTVRVTPRDYRATCLHSSEGTI